METPLFKLNGRIWIEIDDDKVLGHGRVELLERIHASGSIRQAALQMKMSYKQAWDLVNHMNDGFKQPLVISKRGGKGGGVALLTPFGQGIVSQFKDLQQKFFHFLEENSKK